MKINGMNQANNDEASKKLKMADSKLQKKEIEIRDLVDSNLKKSSELKKTIALLEQRIDL